MKNKKNSHMLCIFLFMGYISVLVYFLFFAEMLGRTSLTREYSYNLVLFKEIKRFIRYRRKLGTMAVWMNLMGNVAAFIPFGIFIPALFKKNAHIWQITFSTMIFSLLIESVQLVSKVGSFDVDDILLNTIGGFLGAVLFYIVRRLRKCGKE